MVLFCRAIAVGSKSIASASTIRWVLISAVEITCYAVRVRFQTSGAFLLITDRTIRYSIVEVACIALTGREGFVVAIRAIA